MSTKRNIAFIINPKAGMGLFPNIDKRIANRFSSGDINAIILKTERAGHAIEYCRELIGSATPPDAIVAVGGDGTVNEVVNGIGLSGMPMGIVPVGSGNGLARHLGISMLPAAALGTIEKGYSMPVDMMKIGKNKWAANVAGVGFDALISWKFRGSKTRGPLSYVKIIVEEFLKFAPKKYRIEIDKKPIDLEANMITIANSEQFGNNAKIAPGASVSDGLLDLCVLKPFPKAFAGEIGARIMAGTIDKSPYYQRFKGKEIIIKQKPDAYQLDGEYEGNTSVVSIKIYEKKLRMIFPEKNKNKI